MFTLFRIHTEKCYNCILSENVSSPASTSNNITVILISFIYPDERSDIQRRHEWKYLNVKYSREPGNKLLTCKYSTFRFQMIWLHVKWIRSMNTNITYLWIDLYFTISTTEYPLVRTVKISFKITMWFIIKRTFT